MGRKGRNGTQYWYICPDMQKDTNQELDEKALSWESLRQLTELPCRKVLMLDTCHAGNIGEIEKANLSSSQVKPAISPLKRDGYMVVMATQSGKKASENFRYGGGHGVFTHALLQALQGGADGHSSAGPSQNRDGNVSLLEVVNYVKETVPQLTEDVERFEQIPTFTPLRQFEAADPLKLMRYQLPRSDQSTEPGGN